MSPDENLPRWDLSTIYPGLDSPEFARAVNELERAVARLGAEILRLETGPTATATGIMTVLDDYNHLLALAIRIDGYAHCSVVSGGPHSGVDQWPSRTASAWSRLEAMNRRLMAAASRLANDSSALAGSLSAHRFWLDCAGTIAAHTMSPQAELLASELAGSGSVRWQQLRNNIVDNLAVETHDAGEQPIPLVRLQQHGSHPDRKVRCDAHRLEIGAWEANAAVMATAFIAIKSEAATLSRMRGWESPLDQSLFDNRIDRKVLHAALAAAEAILPDFQRYLRIKARLLGMGRLAWYDLFAPIPGESVSWTFDEARDLVIDTFTSYSDTAGKFAAHAFSSGWIDAEPRAGKRGGGLCIPVGSGESRLSINFTPTFAGLRVLAHEMGHAWHNHCLHQAGHSAIQHVMTPWVLSETAAIFFETLVRDAALSRADDGQLLVETEAALQYWCRHVVDVLSAFRFESSVFERIERGTLSHEDLCSLMRQAQSTIYGDAIDHDTFHAYMWAAKPHGFDAASSFNSYPYLLGTLLSLGLFARQRADPERFPDAFDELLSSTGIGDAATLMSGFGIDLRSEAFWRTCTAVISDEIERFEALASDVREARVS